jgi:hypothetical protein
MVLLAGLMGISACGQDNPRFLVRPDILANIEEEIEDTDIEEDAYLDIDPLVIGDGGTDADEGTDSHAVEGYGDEADGGPSDTDEEEDQAILPDEEDDSSADFKGRLGFSVDGNYHDREEFAATTFACAIVFAAGLHSKVVHYDYNSHLGETNEWMELQMRISALGAAERFRLDKAVFYNDQKELSGAVDNIAAQINKSSQDDPFVFIVAGPMEVAWRGIDKSEQTKRQYVTVISHSEWNDSHSDTSQLTHTWEDIKNTGVKTIHIKEQNPLLQASYDEYSWWKNNPNPDMAWLWDRLKSTGKDNANPSDAGMAYFVVTGMGDEEADPEKLEFFFENGLPDDGVDTAVQSKLVFETAQDGDSFKDVIPYVRVGLDAWAKVDRVSLYVDEVFVRTEKYFPYEWKAIYDSELKNLSKGAHILTAVAQLSHGIPVSASITVILL